MANSEARACPWPSRGGDLGLGPLCYSSHVSDPPCFVIREVLVFFIASIGVLLRSVRDSTPCLTPRILPSNNLLSRYCSRYEDVIRLVCKASHVKYLMFLHKLFSELGYG